ncbi:hypothetical protein QTP86_009391 [Hemibagrus guttatus]|nr:hypothetical protein QTP86_009391 [Hemibagrus guttatus]
MQVTSAPPTSPASADFFFLGKKHGGLRPFIDYRGLNAITGCPLSPVLFIVFMDRISRRSQGLEGVRFEDYRISSLIFADDVVLLAPSSLDLQHALGCFAAECEAAGMRVSTSKSEAMVLNRKKVACTLQVGGEVLPQVEEFKYLGVLFTSEGRMDREIDRRIGAAAAVMRSMYRSVVVKKELSQKAKLLIYQSIYVPTLTYGHDRKEKEDIRLFKKNLYKKKLPLHGSTGLKVKVL